MKEIDFEEIKQFVEVMSRQVGSTKVMKIHNCIITFFQRVPEIIDLHREVMNEERNVLV
ncbi:hypothetical protein LC728_10575 [Bacillus amyloliquefaciens]|uniref:hypothetical protein n=1 Tax=Bacillus TaxID=1386 RepID=UPI001CD2E8D3|nr:MULTISPECIES: hypothetical protein [Bacillus amyloliquefaciens group]MCA1214826.1 hypothetical protein [Bacillus amyloliquefaciens]MED3231579.1 hypothetical protein [Bacillus velezensis]MED3511444.1 hypothetical protein [Bacillus velezensis]